MNPPVDVVAGAPTRTARPWYLAGDILFFAASVLVICLRLQPLLARHAPTGNDWGEWLLIGHAYLGMGLRSPGALEPPLVPLLAVGTAALLGPTVAFSALAAIGSAAPAAGLYIALRPLGHGVRTALACCLLLLASSSAEQAAWGGLPELIGLGCMPPLLVSLAMNLDRPTRAWLVAFGVSLFLLFATTEIIAAEALPAILVVVALAFLLTRRGHRARLARRLLPLTVAATPTVLLTPVYIHLLASTQIGFATNHSEVFTLAAKFTYMFREDPNLWKVCIAIAAFTPVLAFSRRHSPDAATYQAGAGFVIASAAMAVCFANVRFFYLVPPAATFGVALFLGSIRVRARDPSTWIVAGAFVAVLGVNLGFEGAGAFRLYPQQVTFYGNLSLSPQLLQAVEWLGRHSRAQDLVVVSDLAGNPLGWWVEGLANRPALVDANPQLLYLKGQRRSAAQAQSILAAFPSPSAITRARRLGVSYIFIARASAQYHPQQTQGFIERHPTLVAFSNEGALIIRVTATS